MKIEEIYALMDRFESGNLCSMELSCEDYTLKLKKAQPAALPFAEAPRGEAAPDAEGTGEASPGESIVSPLAGTFYTSPEPGADPFVTPGAHVKAGQTLCLVEAMKTMNEITAPCDCLILSILAEDAAVVSYGEELIRYTKE